MIAFCRLLAPAGTNLLRPQSFAHLLPSVPRSIMGKAQKGAERAAALATAAVHVGGNWPASP